MGMTRWRGEERRRSKRWLEERREGRGHVVMGRLEGDWTSC